MRDKKVSVALKLVFFGLPGLVLFAVAGLFSRRLRLVTVPMSLAAAGYFAWDLFDRPPAPDESLTPAEVRQVFGALLKRVKPGGVNHLHSRRLYYYAGPFAAAAGANPAAVRAAALLHDSTKEDGRGEPKERFCTHGEQGAEYTREVLLGLPKSKPFSEHAAQEVREHMGPCGYNWRYFDRRFMSKFCPDQSFPSPKSLEARVLYDIDMLDLMTVDGVVKVVELRQTNPEFAKEPLKDSALSGNESAWRSVQDASQTLLTSAAQDCGAELVEHSKAFLDGVDWKAVKDVASFKAASREYLAAHPLPACLPNVPPCGSSQSLLEEGLGAGCG
jgi:hypothetical protein